MTNFDWNDLRFFLDLARQGRLQATAKRMRVDYSTVSRRIGELERAIGCKLFTRELDGFKLTSGGLALFARAESIEANALMAVEEVGAQLAPAAGTVRVSTMDGMASFLAAGLLDFHRRNPHINVELITVAQPANLPKREADISVSMSSPRGSRLNNSRVGSFSVSLYGSEKYFSRMGMRNGELNARHVYIDYIDSLVQTEEVRWLRDLVEQPSVIFTSTSLLVQLQAAKSGIGIVALPTYLVPTDGSLIRVGGDEVRITRDLWLSIHEDAAATRRNRYVAKAIKQIIRGISEY